MRTPPIAPAALTLVAAATACLVSAAAATRAAAQAPPPTAGAQAAPTPAPPGGPPPPAAPTPIPVPVPAPTPVGSPFAPPAAPPPSVTVPGPAAPADAAGALERARAAYEYGDIDEVVTWARQVAEGRLHPTTGERVQALRYLGIGLYLTGRAEGAETAFFELMRLRPDSRLDPKTTRPDVISFFEAVRRRHDREIREAARESNPKSFFWNLLPPFGQFQNGHRGRGYTLLAIEVLSGATAITTYALLKHWEKPHNEFDDVELAKSVKTANLLSLSVFAVFYALGIIDGIAHYGDVADDAAPATTAFVPRLTPTGLTLDF